MILIDCETLEHLGLWQPNDCCGGCHADEIEGYHSIWGGALVDNEKVATYLCCNSIKMGTVDTLRDVIERLKDEEQKP